GPGVVGLGAPLDEEAVDQPAALAPPVAHPVPSGAEPHADPDTRLGVGVEFLGHGVVEVAVEVEDALVDEDAGDRQLAGQGGAPPGTRLGPGDARRTDGLPDERELLRRCVPRIAVRPSVLAAHACILTKRHRQPGARRPPREGSGGDARGPAPRRRGAGPWRTGGPDYSPAALRSSSTRSVRSQVKSGSSRPKWP